MQTNWNSLRIRAVQALLEIERRPQYSPTATLEQAIRARYNMERSFGDYCSKFQNLDERLRMGGDLLEIGAGEGIAFDFIVNHYPVKATATNLIESRFSTQAMANSLPFASGTFDIVLAIHSLTWEPEQRKAIEEIRRVLRPGGLGFVDLFRFSEISQLWFGVDFWRAGEFEDYVFQCDFSPKLLLSQDSVRSEAVVDAFPLTEQFFIEIRT